MLRSETPDTSVLLEYLKHEDTEDLQFLTINDFTFVNNRTIKPTTSYSNVDIRNYEGFVELTNLKYAKEYNVFLNTVADDNGASETIVSAAAIVCNRVNWDKNDGGKCKFTATQNFTVDSASGIEHWTLL